MPQPTNFSSGKYTSMFKRTVDEFISHASKYCVGLEGNISVKTENCFLIKASGKSLKNSSLYKLVECDLDGNVLNEDNGKPSMEVGFHKFLLGFNDINYVSHTHPVNTLKILSSKQSHIFASHRLFPDQVIFNGKKSCLVPYAKPGDDLTEMVKEYVNKFIVTEGYFPKIILLQNHGIITCGSSSNECIIATDICEKAAEIYVGVRQMQYNFLTSKEVDDLINDEKEKYRQEQL